MKALSPTSGYSDVRNVRQSNTRKIYSHRHAPLLTQILMTYFWFAKETGDYINFTHSTPFWLSLLHNFLQQRAQRGHTFTNFVTHPNIHIHKKRITDLQLKDKRIRRHVTNLKTPLPYGRHKCMALKPELRFCAASNPLQMCSSHTIKKKNE